MEPFVGAVSLHMRHGPRGRSLARHNDQSGWFAGSVLHRTRTALFQLLRVHPTRYRWASVMGTLHESHGRVWNTAYARREGHDGGGLLPQRVGWSDCDRG